MGVLRRVCGLERFARNGQSISFFNVLSPDERPAVTTAALPYYLWFELDRLILRENIGLWLPAGYYGVETVLIPESLTADVATILDSPVQASNTDDDWIYLGASATDRMAVDEILGDWYLESHRSLTFEPATSGYHHYVVSPASGTP